MMQLLLAGPAFLRRRAPLLIGVATLVSVLAPSRVEARERRFSRDYRAPVAYQLELEPHLVFGFDPPGSGIGSGAGIGARGSLVVAPQGLIDRVNNSVAIGFGIDYVHYDGSWAIDGYRDQCLHFAPGPAGTSVCTEVTSHGGRYDYVFLPIVMQWNFWLNWRFSAFVEPGLDIYYFNHHGMSLGPAVYLGGRVLLTDQIALILRIGYPTSSFGVSFLF